MNKRFKFAHFNSNHYQCVSLSLTNEGIDYLYEEIQSELKRCQAKGRILLDMLLSHGYKSERFVSLYFDGDKFDFESYQIENNIDSVIEDYCSGFFRENHQLLEKSVLTKPQRFLFRKGKANQLHRS